MSKGFTDSLDLMGRAKRYVDNLQKVADEVRMEVNSQVLKEIDKEAKALFKSRITEFYADYSPEFYAGDRHESLFNLYKFIILNANEGDYDNGYDVNEITPTRKGGGKQYMYDTVFKAGYHGGADKGPKHPRPGTPFYRKYPPELSWMDFNRCWRFWSRPAMRSTPPYELFEGDLDKLFEEKGPRWTELFYEKYNKRAGGIRW